MTAAPPGAQDWKSLLMLGEVDRTVAATIGRMLAAIVRASWRNPESERVFGDQTVFDQLRIDPYYRQIARVHADLAPAIGRLIDSVWQHRLCLAHGDFSPKNLLVWPGHVMLIDFEVGHYGDPAFDLGFFLTHLVLKSTWAGQRRGEYLALASEFWWAYRATMEQATGAEELASLEARTVWNLAGCMLARVDGKSPVDYLSADHQRLVRDVARQWLSAPPRTWNGACAVLRAEY